MAFAHLAKPIVQGGRLLTRQTGRCTSLAGRVHCPRKNRAGSPRLSQPAADPRCRAGADSLPHARQPHAESQSGADGKGKSLTICHEISFILACVKPVSYGLQPCLSMAYAMHGR